MTSHLDREQISRQLWKRYNTDLSFVFVLNSSANTSHTQAGLQAEMFRQMISRISTYPRSLLSASNYVTPSTKIALAPQAKLLSTTQTFGRNLHSYSILKPSILQRSCLIPVGGQSVISSRILPLGMRSQQGSPLLNLVQTRGVIKWSNSKGKRGTVKAVIKRFKRLNWPGRGIWIRARAGASKRMWKKNSRRKIRAKYHVFCNATQSKMLDKMVTRYWRRPRFYPDDPYRAYMKRDHYYQNSPYPREYF